VPLSIVTTPECKLNYMVMIVIGGATWAVAIYLHHKDPST